MIHSTNCNHTHIVGCQTWIPDLVEKAVQTATGSSEPGIELHGRSPVDRGLNSMAEEMVIMAYIGFWPANASQNDLSWILFDFLKLWLARAYPISETIPL